MDPDQERVRHRADELLPEERAAGSDDPQAQAAAILADSDEREYDPEAAPGHRARTPHVRGGDRSARLIRSTDPC